MAIKLVINQLQKLLIKGPFNICHVSQEQKEERYREKLRYIEKEKKTETIERSAFSQT